MPIPSVLEVIANDTPAHELRHRVWLALDKINEIGAARVEIDDVSDHRAFLLDQVIRYLTGDRYEEFIALVVEGSAMEWDTGREARI